MTEFDVCSDLHLEFDLDFYGYLDRPYIDNLFSRGSSDNLIIAGDLFAIPYKDSAQLFDDIIGTVNEVVKSRYNNAYFVLGNHDYWYHYNGDQLPVNFWTEKLPSFNVLDISTNPVAQLDDLVIFGSTGWTEINNVIKQSLVQRWMNDYQYSDLTAGYTSKIASDTRQQIDTVAKQHTDKKVVVITHHAPLQQCQYVHKDLPEAYFNCWDKLLDDNPNIVTWIHGHVHQQYQFQHNKCTVVSNARGYYDLEPIAQNFYPLKVVVK